jgi:hypothetical protein
MNPWFAIAATAIPEVRAIVVALLAFRKKYPDITPEQIQAVVIDMTLNADGAYDAAVSALDAYEKAHPPTTPTP